MFVSRGHHNSDEHDDMSPAQHSRETTLEAAKDKIGRHLLEATIRIDVATPPDSKEIAERVIRELVGAFGAFSSPRLASFRRCRRSRRPFLLSTEELATLWHLPTCNARAPRMDVTEYRRLEPPRGLPTRREDGEQFTELGETNHREQRQVFGLKLDDRRRHLFVVGKTGMGKSTLLRNMLVSDIEQGGERDALIRMEILPNRSCSRSRDAEPMMSYILMPEIGSFRSSSTHWRANRQNNARWSQPEF